MGLDSLQQPFWSHRSNGPEKAARRPMVRFGGQGLLVCGGGAAKDANGASYVLNLPIADPYLNTRRRGDVGVKSLKV